MTLAIFLVIAAALALVVVLGIAISRGLQVPPDRSLAAQLQPIDVAAFRNLVDPAEDAYLRRRLPPAEFRTVRRERLRAMAVYVQTARRNAAILVRMGQDAMVSSDARTLDAARQLVDNALLLRSNATIALVRISVAWAWPDAGLAATPVLQGYERLNGSAMLLGRLQNPAAPVRIAATS
jgi:hypothetical protein